jgi:hypothetical protein
VPQRFNNCAHDFRNKRHQQPYPTSSHNYELDNLIFTRPPVTPFVSDLALHEQIQVHILLNTLTNHGSAANDVILCELDLSRLELIPDNTLANNLTIDTTVDAAMGTHACPPTLVIILLIMTYLLFLAQTLTLAD